MNEPVESKELEDWPDFINTIIELDVGPIEHINYIYRGHAVSSWELKSSFHRIVDVNNISALRLLEIENKAIRKFGEQAHQFLPPHLASKTQDTIEWLGLMQHYGAPTRLLDWSLSPFVAAYNACIEQLDSPGAIWVLHKYYLRKNMETIGGYKESPGTDEVLFYKSLLRSEEAPQVVYICSQPFKTDRMVSQQGVFSVGCNIKDIQHNIITSALPKHTTSIRLLKLIISPKLKIRFLRKLHQMNVSANSLFPGIDGLGRSVNEFVKLMANQ